MLKPAQERQRGWRRNTYHPYKYNGPNNLVNLVEGGVAGKEKQWLSSGMNQRLTARLAVVVIAVPMQSTRLSETRITTSDGDGDEASSGRTSVPGPNAIKR